MVIISNKQNSYNQHNMQLEDERTKHLKKKYGEIPKDLDVNFRLPYESYRCGCGTTLKTKEENTKSEVWKNGG